MNSTLEQTIDDAGLVTDPVSPKVESLMELQRERSRLWNRILRKLGVVPECDLAFVEREIERQFDHKVAQAVRDAQARRVL